MDDALVRRLVQLAYNLRWSWQPNAAHLFATLDPETWQRTHNAVAVLQSLSHTDVGSLSAHAAAIRDACEELEHYLHLTGHRPFGEQRIAYLCAEFAIAECLPLYAGGLGVLAGDHLKAASDLGLAVVGVGLLYNFGYFRQALDESGYQREYYDKMDPTSLPVRPVFIGDRVPLRIAVPLGRRSVYARVWRVEVGRVPLYLLDTDIPENRADDRWITAHLYGGDRDTRIRQEIVLGIGGARLLSALRLAGIEPAVSVYHLNEGHSAFAVLELARQRLRLGEATTFDEAASQVARTVAFTTHTPVMAGHDTFSAELIDSYLGPYCQDLGLTADQLMSFGRMHPRLPSESFSMTLLALRGAARRNAVSQLHGTVSRQMWAGIGLGVHDEHPSMAMGAITNGVHGPTWAGPEMSALFDACLGPAWRIGARHADTWTPLQLLGVEPMWHARTAQRARLLSRAGRHLDPRQALVIGFARRFATYKRAGLLLEDRDRLIGLMTADPGRSLVIVFAGKAHPYDQWGKELIQRIVEASRDPRFGGRLVFLPDYDVDMARLLVQGADVWLNTPRRPHEASGTSGMKAALNGALQVSELDGWWSEAYAPDLGWAIGMGLPDDLTESQRDMAEARQLMDLLEQQVIPLYFTRDTASGVPVEWLMRVKRSIGALAPLYSAERMVAEYAVQVYAPAAGDRTGIAREQPGSVQQVGLPSIM